MSDFTTEVYKIVKSIPKGRVMTYKQVASLAGNKKAMRAVGNALNKNKDFKNVPCHRVVRSDGKIGGYVFGSTKKSQILALEGVVTIKDKVDLKQYQAV
ncbi:MAG: MGMT family protein [Candidatus Magasanikiibacteriota bacterium]